MTEFITNSPAETEALGAEFARRLGGKKLVGFIGELGAGKTVFIRGMARELGYTGRVTSPTFALVNEYRENGKLIMCHFDLCRLTSDELEDIGWYDYLASGALCVAEWADNALCEFSADAVIVTVTGSGESTRTITIENIDWSKNEASCI